MNHPPSTRRSPRRALATKARAAVLWALAVVLFAHVGLAVAIERWLPQLRDTMFGGQAVAVRQRLDAARAESRPLTVVVLGSSRVQWGVRGKELEAALTHQLGRPVMVFNLGMPAAGPLRELLAFNQLRRQGIRPDLVLVEVLPAQLSTAWDAPIATPKLGLADVPVVAAHAGGEELQHQWWAEQAAPWFTYRKALLLNVLPILLSAKTRRDERPLGADETCTPDPYPADQSPASKARGKVLARETYEGQMRDFHAGTGGTVLRDLLGRLQAQHIPAALLVMPEGPEFRQWCPPESWAKMEAIIQSLSRDFAVPLINARTWQPEGDFFDSHHLLLPGARAFTDRLGCAAVAPLLRTICESGPDLPAGRLLQVKFMP